MDQIPGCISAGDLSKVKELPVFRDLTLADPEYSYNSKLDLLLGIAHCNQCSLAGTVLSDDKFFKAEKTIFGWAVGGISESKPSASSPTSNSLTIAPVQKNVELLLQQYWVFEEIPGDSSSLTKEERAAVTHFRETHSRDSDGHYVVHLPKQEPRKELGKSKEVAIRRYLSNEHTGGTCSTKE